MQDLANGINLVCKILESQYLWVMYRFAARGWFFSSKKIVRVGANTAVRHADEIMQKIAENLGVNE